MSLFGNNKKSPVWIQKTHYLKSDEFICSVCGFKAKKAYLIVKTTLITFSAPTQFPMQKYSFII